MLAFHLALLVFLREISCRIGGADALGMR